ncbi:MAG: hypothetical protein HRT77_04605 [Halioglobus sp.]|nr:hypothetical protein [Halioglobus sp.]
MKVQQLTKALLLLLIVSLPVTSEAFVGGLAVSLGRATNVSDAEIPPFSADAQMKTDDQKMVSRVYFQPGMVRDEADMDGMPIVTIQRYDAGKVWILMGEDLYMETDIGKVSQTPDYTLIERTMEGTEVINGEETTKYKTIYDSPEGRFMGFTWFTKDNIAVKGYIVSEADGKKQRLEWTMTNVQREDQPDALFELPAGSEEMAGMEHLMQLMGGASPSAGAVPERLEITPDNAEDMVKGALQEFGNLLGR